LGGCNASAEDRATASVNFAAHPEAIAEIREAMHWYESRVPGLGATFLAAVDEANRRVTAAPLSAPTVELEGRVSQYRKVRVRRFPYLLIYLPGQSFFVVAVAHERRRPAYWAARADPKQ
jgi:toxin ParE1/3/4